jgi:hypothetical protein
MSAKKSKGNPIYQGIGAFIIAAFAWAWLTVPGGPAGAIVNLAVAMVTTTIMVISVAAFVQAWRIPAISASRAGPVLRRMHDGGRRLLERPRVTLPAVLAGALLLPYGTEGAVLAAVLYAAGRPPKPEVEPEPDVWYAARAMAGHLSRAGVLRDGTWLPYQPRLVRDDAYGTTVDVHLPFGMVAAQVIARRDAVASSLGVPPTRLTVSVPQDAPANVVRLFVGHAPSSGARVMPRPSLVTTMTRTDWHRQPRLGATAEGEPVWGLTHEANTLISGVMGYGKTSVARQLVAHALLDPAARVRIVDGKGSRADWGAAEPSCERFILGTMPDAVEQVEAMLTELVGIVQARNDATDRNAPGHKPGALVLVLDEWQDIRAAADKKAGERIDTLLGRVVRMGRAVGVHVIVVTQRPTVEDVPSGVRNLLSQRVALVTRNAVDAALILGETPTLALPTKRGQALIATPTGTVAAQLDNLSHEAWEAVCVRAAALRARRATAAPTPAQEAPEAPETFAETAPEPAMPIDPTLSAVLDVLADGPPEGMTAAAVLAALPDHLQPIPPNTAAMGRALGKWADANDPLIRRNRTPSARLWRLSSPVTTPSSTRQNPTSTERNRSVDPSVTPPDAQNGPQTPGNGPPDAHPSSPVTPSRQEAQP